MLQRPAGFTDLRLAVSMHEITWAQYDPADEGGRHQALEQQSSRKLTSAEPAFGVNWFEAVDYCRWLTERAGMSAGDQCDEDPQSLPKDADRNPRHTAYYPERRGFRLTTEAEWEYVCRSGMVTAYGFGNDPGLLADSAAAPKNCPRLFKSVSSHHLPTADMPHGRSPDSLWAGFRHISMRQRIRAAMDLVDTVIQPDRLPAVQLSVGGRDAAWLLLGRG